METTRITGRIFENTWECPHCGKKNRGRDRECINCGKPRGKETVYDHQHIARLEGEEARKYMTGPDWLCEYCESYNSANLKKCKSCGAPKDANKDYFKVRQEQEEKEHQNTISMHQDKSTLPSFSFRIHLPIILSVVGIIAAVIGLIWLLVWAVIPEQKSGTVSELTWRTSVSLQELVTEKDEGWDPPINARITDQEWSYKDTVQEIDHYDTVTVPVTKYRTVQDEDRVWYSYEDMGNGFDMEVEHREPQYHQEPYTDYEEQQIPVYKDVDVYAYWYVWEINRWITVDTKTTSGNKGTEHDPVLKVIRSRQRTTDYTRTFHIIINTDEDEKLFTISKKLYDKIESGDSIVYETSNIGTFKILKINGFSIE